MRFPNTIVPLKSSIWIFETFHKTDSPNYHSISRFISSENLFSYMTAFWWIYLNESIRHHNNFNISFGLFSSINKCWFTSSLFLSFDLHDLFWSSKNLDREFRMIACASEWENCYCASCMYHSCKRCVWQIYTI